MSITWISYLLALFGFSWVGVGLFRWYAIEKGILDKPNNRSSHKVPTARGGGVIFFAGWSIVLFAMHYFHYLNDLTIWQFVPAMVIGLIGFIDDRNSLSALTRFIFQCLAAAAFLFMSEQGGAFIKDWLPFLPLPLCFSVLVFAMVWLTNLFNFMDGTDGFAASEAMFIFAVGGYLLFEYGALELGILAWGLVALLAGFLTWNWPAARIFMGDSGSCFLGFLVAVYAIVGCEQYQISIMYWVILTSLFWFDATITLLRRMLAREEWYKPHRSHAYQRLIQAGWSHQRVLLCAMGANIVLSFLTLLAHHDPRLLGFSFAMSIAFLSCLYLIVELIRPMYKTWWQA